MQRIKIVCITRIVTFTYVNCINVIKKTKYKNFILTLNVIFIACIFYTLYSS